MNKVFFLPFLVYFMNFPIKAFSQDSSKDQIEIITVPCGTIYEVWVDETNIKYLEGSRDTIINDDITIAKYDSLIKKIIAHDTIIPMAKYELPKRRLSASLLLKVHWHGNSELVLMNMSGMLLINSNLYYKDDEFIKLIKETNVNAVDCTDW